MSTEPSELLTRDELADLLVETGQHHHRAYADSDGVDPEWALWYAGYLQARMWTRAGALPTRSQLVHLLLQGEAQLAEAGGDTPWPQLYADVILETLSSPD